MTAIQQQLIPTSPPTQLKLERLWNYLNSKKQSRPDDSRRDFFAFQVVQYQTNLESLNKLNLIVGGFEFRWLARSILSCKLDNHEDRSCTDQK